MPSATLDRSMPALAQMNPCRGLADDEVAATAHDAHRLPLDQGGLGRRIVGVDGDEAPLGLGDHLLGDDEHVACAQVGPVAHGRRQGAGHHAGQIGTGRDLADAGEGNEGDALRHGRRSPPWPGRRPARRSP